jgi:Transposase DDE domain group 1
VILRPGKTPDGAEVALVLRHVVKAIRRRWPRVDILIRGDSHYGRHEAMAWCEHNRVGYVFGLAGNQAQPAKAA